MQIGIIGAGKIGSTVGRLWAKAGHKVRFATRHPDELKDLAKEIGDNASVGTSEDAASFGEVVFVAVPFGAWPALAKEIGAAPTATPIVYGIAFALSVVVASSIVEIVFPAYKKGGVARSVVVHRAGVGRGMYHLKKRPDPLLGERKVGF
jgi:predicted dinucleotide-binding enzyme